MRPAWKVSQNPSEKSDITWSVTWVYSMSFVTSRVKNLSLFSSILSMETGCRCVNIVPTSRLSPFAVVLSSLFFRPLSFRPRQDVNVPIMKTSIKQREDKLLTIVIIWSLRNYRRWTCLHRLAKILERLWLSFANRLRILMNPFEQFEDIETQRDIRKYK